MAHVLPDIMDKERLQTCNAANPQGEIVIFLGDWGGFTFTGAPLLFSHSEVATEKKVHKKRRKKQRSPT